MKKKLEEQKVNAVNVAIPNTTELKLKAILDVSAAVRDVARALNSVNVQVTIANNVITGTGIGSGISINAEEKDGA